MKASSTGTSTPHTSSHNIHLDEYFAGPLDVQRHSKWPFFLRLRGSILPKMILPLLFVAAWSTAITLIHKRTHASMEVNTVLLTVLGFVVGLALSFRCSTAYERYSDGRKYWSQLSLLSRNLSRLIWIHVNERHVESAELGKADLLGKLAAIDLLNAFAVALKHRLRFEPATNYPDMAPLVSRLTHIMAISADQAALQQHKTSSLKRLGEYLGVSFAQSNPRKLIKRSADNLGNPPLEVLTYLQSYIAQVIDNKSLALAGAQISALNDIRAMADVLCGCERVLNTPLPIAYNISISQITWVYIVALPFQLVGPLQWVTIPASLVAAYIILGLAIIGREIENPFGNDVNDLPLDHYCREIATDIDVLTSMPAPSNSSGSKDSSSDLSLGTATFESWKAKSVDEIRQSLRVKVVVQAKTLVMESQAASLGHHKHHGLGHRHVQGQKSVEETLQAMDDMS